MTIKTLAFLTMISLLLPSVVSAQTYPQTCPQEAVGVLNAVGGCSAVDCSLYPSICNKCCTVATNQTVSQTTATPMDYIPILILIILIGIFLVWKMKSKRNLKRKSK